VADLAGLRAWLKEAATTYKTLRVVLDLLQLMQHRELAR